MKCPRCSNEMVDREHGDFHVYQCPDGHGVFLARADLGGLGEAEAHWHAGAGHQTQAMPRITSDMTAPPASVSRANSFIESLFA